MASRRDKLVKKLMRGVTGKDEATLMKLTVERVCADMCEFYLNFYDNEGPGAMVYVPDSPDEEKSMFYLTVDHLMNALDDFTKRSMDGEAGVMKQAIARAEPIDPAKEALFIIQDKDRMSLIHYKIDCDGANFVQM